MDRRTELQSILENLLGSSEVYFKAPKNKGMAYPAIVYKIDDVILDRANNNVYKKTKRYQLTVISTSPYHPVIDKILDLPYTNYVRNYMADGLQHDVILIHY